MTQPGKDEVGIGINIRAGQDNSKLDRSKIGNNEIDNKVDDEVGKKDQNSIKSKNLSKSKKMELGFFTSEARIAFTKLKQAFIKAPILHHFDLEYYIQIETDASDYAIG